MAYFQEDASIRYINYVDDDIHDSEGKLSGLAGTVSASFHHSGDVGLHVYGTDSKAVLSLTLGQAKHLVSVLLEVEKIHASNQKTKGE